MSDDNVIRGEKDIYAKSGIPKEILILYWIG